MPKIVSPIKSIANLKGWAKDDIAKWYEFNTAFNSLKTRDQILKIELAKIKYEEKMYLCVAGFTKHFYIKAGTKRIEYSAFFWLLDTTKSQTVQESDTSVHTRLYQNKIISTVIGYYKPTTWNDILVQMKKCFIGTYPNEVDSSNYETRKTLNRLTNKINPPGIDESYDPYKNFFIKYRYDYKNNKAQFFIGTLEEDHFSEVRETNGKSYKKFDYSNSFLLLDCYDKEKNRNLNCRYFEVSKNSFDNCFKQIIN